MNQSENYSDEDWAALSPEQQDEVVRVERSVREFLSDRRAIRYIVNDANGDALQNFLSTHGLDTTHRNLLFAFDSLQDDLELVPLAAPVVQDLPPAPSQRPTPVPTSPDPRAPQAFRNGRPIAFTNPRPL